MNCNNGDVISFAVFPLIIIIIKPFNFKSTLYVFKCTFWARGGEATSVYIYGSL